VAAAVAACSSISEGGGWAADGGGADMTQTGDQTG
jgi:hypothetical protein